MWYTGTLYIQSNKTGTILIPHLLKELAQPFVIDLRWSPRIYAVIDLRWSMTSRLFALALIFFHLLNDLVQVIQWPVNGVHDLRPQEHGEDGGRGEGQVPRHRGPRRHHDAVEDVSSWSEFKAWRRLYTRSEIRSCVAKSKEITVPTKMRFKLQEVLRSNPSRCWLLPCIFDSGKLKKIFFSGIFWRKFLFCVFGTEQPK